MKTERRHELETNTLAHGLNDWGERLRPYSSTILGVVAALLVLYIGVSLWNSYQESRDRAAWDAYQAAVIEGDADLSSLQRLANSEDFAGTDVQEWALLGWADRQLLLASRMYLTDRDGAKEKLTNIVEIYKQFADSGSTVELRNRARLGLGRLQEMRGNLEEAKQQYQQVQGALSAVAAERIKALDSQRVQSTIDWLATATLPKPAPSKGPGTPGDRPGFEASTPATDPLGAMPGGGRSLEEILSGLGGSAGTPPAEATGPAATPAGGTPPNAQPAGTADQPAAPAEQPAEGEEPAKAAEEAVSAPAGDTSPQGQAAPPTGDEAAASAPADAPEQGAAEPAEAEGQPAAQTNSEAPETKPADAPPAQP
ncbi:MAG: tetratricopeptide repeat protein [Pirellulales bacterium]|nr:tetratricopeptide repeat protein [Pirellulales bacterium]